MITPRHLPFSNTKVDPERTKGQIITLLKSFGITDYAWAEDMGRVSLAFKAEVEYEGSPKLWNIIIHPPILVDTKRVWDEARRMTVKKDIPNHSQSYRILLKHLKAKLTAVACGLVKFEEEFMADIAVQTREGPKSLAEAIKQYQPKFLLEGPSDEAVISEKKPST